jgi:hypothetical protein
MTSQQPPEGLSAEELESARWIADHQPRDARELLHKIINAARSTSPAPDPKAGEREQVAEAVERLRFRMEEGPRLWEAFDPDADEFKKSKGIVVRVADLNTTLSALAEARSEVERVKAESKMNYDDATQLTGRLEAAEAERDTLAAQLVGAREALEPFAALATERSPGQRHTSPIYGIERQTGTGELRLYSPFSDTRDELTMLTCDFFKAARVFQALSMSILRGDKGCSLGAIEAPSCGSPDVAVKPSEGGQ